MDKGIYFVIATLVAQRIQEYFSLDAMSFGIICGVINNFFDKFDPNNYSDYKSYINFDFKFGYINVFYFLWKIILFFVVIYIFYKIKNWLMDHIKVQYLSAEISLVN